mmetsp:Transcript_27632/g.24473  ORF Transcript_27632/g.24473 Transcript_27632/m.24473 type:complete len:144 (-) Transcript_27632:119-550(-)
MDDKSGERMAPPLLEDDDVQSPIFNNNALPPLEPPAEGDEPAEYLIPAPEEQKMDAFNIYKEGWVYKQSRYWKSWRKRWSVITRTHLYTYKLEQEYLLKGPGCFTECIECSDISKVQSAKDELGIDNSFMLITRKDKTAFYFY